MARYLSILFAVMMFLVVSCSSQQPKPELKAPTDFLDDIQTDTLSDELFKENMEIKESYNVRQVKVEEFETKDEAETQQLMVTQEKMSAAEEKLVTKILDAIKTEEVAELLENEEVATLVEKAGSQEELIQRLRENTDLNEEEIQQLAKYKKLTVEITAAKDAEGLKQILEENTQLSMEEIGAIVEEKKTIVQQKTELKYEMLATIYTRLKRNREAGIDEAFCSGTSALDHHIISPVYYNFDSYTLDKKSAQNLFNEANFIYDEVQKYDGLILQIEGNCDERGSNAYNKALGDRRWSSAFPYLTAQIFDEEEVKGVSKGEECQTKKTSDDYEEWWKENRRSDFIWTLK